MILRKNTKVLVDNDDGVSGLNTFCKKRDVHWTENLGKMTASWIPVYQRLNDAYRCTSPIRKRPPLGPYSRPKPGVIWRSMGVFLWARYPCIANNKRTVVWIGWIEQLMAGKRRPLENATAVMDWTVFLSLSLSLSLSLPSPENAYIYIFIYIYIHTHIQV